jgi:transporter family protein
MAAWFWYAVVAAVLYGAHQIFTRMAADHIGEGLGGFVVEASAAFSILIYLGILWFSGRVESKIQRSGFNYSLITGICVGAGTIAFFLLFQKGGPLSSVPAILAGGARSWPSLGFCSFANHHHGKGSPALRSPSLVCSCCANRDFVFRYARARTSNGKRRKSQICISRFILKIPQLSLLLRS